MEGGALRSGNPSRRCRAREVLCLGLGGGGERGREGVSGVIIAAREATRRALHDGFARPADVTWAGEISVGARDRAWRDARDEPSRTRDAGVRSRRCERCGGHPGDERGSIPTAAEARDRVRKKAISGERRSSSSAGSGDREFHAPAVLGVTSARRVISMRPAGWPPMVMSKKQTGLDILSVGCVCGVSGAIEV